MKIVSMEKEFGSLLLRHGGQYKRTGISSAKRVSVEMPSNEADFWHTFDSKNAITPVVDPTTLFTEFAVVKVPANKAPSADSATNQTAITVTKLTNSQYQISADWSTLKKYLSTDAYWQRVGAQAWVGVIISTGESDIKTLKFNGASFTQDDVNEVKAYGGGDGDFVLWTYVKDAPTRFTLSKGSSASIIEISFVNTAS